jgi:hypothetical protein
MRGMSTRTVAAAMVLLLGATTAEIAHAQSACNSGAKVLDAIWARWGERVKAKQCKDSAECLGNAQKKEELYREMIAFWNEQSQGSWATIGPRPLTPGSALHDGKVLAGGQRLFISQAALDGDKYELVVTKQDGGAADVTISLYDGKNCLQGRTAAFDKDDKNGTKKTLTIDGAKGLVGIVKVDAKNTNAFDYKFTIAKK